MRSGSFKHCSESIARIYKRKRHHFTGQRDEEHTGAASRRVKPDRKSEVGHGTVARSRGSRGRSQEVARDRARRSTLTSILAPNHTQMKERNIEQRLPSKNHYMWEMLENILSLRRVSGARRLASLQRVILFWHSITIVSTRHQCHCVLQRVRAH